MMEDGKLDFSIHMRISSSFQGGWAPTVAQLRPITLLFTDYKLYTKMLTGCLPPVLPSDLRSSQLYFVQVPSIFEGAAAVLSVSIYLHQRQLPGFLISLDFFHTDDRGLFNLVDRVLDLVVRWIERDEAQVIEVYAFSKAWFSWGRLERLVYDKLHLSLSKDFLQPSSVPDRARSLLAIQASHCLASRGWPAQLLAHWPALRRRHTLPDIGPGLTPRPSMVSSKTWPLF
jgi:hypothetical protein